MAFGIDLWKIVLESNCSEETERDIKIGLDDLYAKAKAFDIFLKYKQHVEKYNNSDCHELERVFQGVIKEYEEDK